MKKGDTVEHCGYGMMKVMATVIAPLAQRDVAVVRDSRGLCYLVLQNELIEKIEDNIRWQEAGF